MPQRGQIRWVQSQVDRLKHAVSVYNSSVVAARKKYGADFAEVLPSTVSYRQLRSELKTGRELDVKVKQLMRGQGAQAFRPVEVNGELVSAYTRREAQITYTARERRKRESRIRRGIEDPVTHQIEPGNVRRMEELGITPTSIPFSELTPKQMQRLSDLAVYERGKSVADRAALYYQNYVRGMETVGIDKIAPDVYEYVADIVANLADENPQYLIDMFESNDEELTIDFVYDKDVELRGRAEQIEAAWQKIAAEGGYYE